MFKYFAAPAIVALSMLVSPMAAQAAGFAPATSTPAVQSDAATAVQKAHYTGYRHRHGGHSWRRSERRDRHSWRRSERLDSHSWRRSERRDRHSWRRSERRDRHSWRRSERRGGCVRVGPVEVCD